MKFLFLCVAMFNSNFSFAYSDFVTNFDWMVDVEFSNSMVVTDRQGTPLAGAKVLIGNDVNTGYRTTTDSQGKFEIPTDWINPASITIEVQGFRRATFLHQLPVARTFNLRRLDGISEMRVTGEVSNFQDLKRDGFVDFGLVMKTKSRNKLLESEVSEFISTRSDIMKVYGKSLALPSNLALPRQKERVGPFPITIEKPHYTLDLKSKGEHSVSAIQGKIHLKTLIDHYRSGKNMVEIVNELKPVAGGLSQFRSQSDLKIDINGHQAIIKSYKSVKAPKLDFGYMMVSTSLNNAGTYIPSDLKVAGSEETRNLGFFNVKDKKALFLITKKYKANSTENWGIAGAPDGQASSAIQDVDTNSNEIAPPDFLDVIKQPVITLLGQNVKLDMPKNTSGINKFGTYMALKSVKEVKTNFGTYEVSHTLWEVYSPNWESEIRVPNWKPPAGKGTFYQWVIQYLGKTGKPIRPIADPRLFDYATHATRNSANF